VSEVRKWLKAIGLAQYAGIFESNISTSLCFSKLTSRHSRDDIDVSTAVPSATHP
jgi:SAM domain (Sterile alpha motif)